MDFLRQGGYSAPPARLPGQRSPLSVNCLSPDDRQAGRRLRWPSGMALLGPPRQGGGQGVGQGFAPQQEGSPHDPEEKRLILGRPPAAPVRRTHRRSRRRSPWGRAEISPAARRKRQFRLHVVLQKQEKEPPSALPWRCAQPLGHLPLDHHGDGLRSRESPPALSAPGVVML